MTPGNAPRIRPPEKKASRTPGAYVLLFRLPRCDRLTIGRLGTFDLFPGSYAYVGSAMGGLEARVGRHLRGGAKKHWHIDHLIERGRDRSAFMIPSGRDIECELAGTIAELPGATSPIGGFGSSDCRCGSHLFLLEQGSLEMLQAHLFGRGAMLVTIDDLGSRTIDRGGPQTT